MKKLFFCLILFFILTIVGCKPKKEIELTRENFSEFCTSKIMKMYIYTNVTNPEKGNWWLYGYEYPINDPKKVEVIKLCIKDANQTEYDRKKFNKNKRTSKQNTEILTFETKKAIYTMTIGWNDEFVYGLWWESADLLRIFKKWGLFEELSKADPSWPAPKRQTQESNQPSQKLSK
jgi:hypothetical protein